MESRNGKTSVKGTERCDVTVAICTYRRPAMVLGVLECLGIQNTAGGIGWEVLVIDNDPECSAKPVVDAHASARPGRLRYIHEVTPGLSRARNRAIREARGNIIAFLDDDVVVPRFWLAELVNTFERTSADCVGGRVLVKWEGKPDDAVLACERELVAFDKGNQDLQLMGRSVPIGANLALRANVLRNEPLFRSGLGRTRTNLMGCEEIELLLRLAKQGRRIWYSAGTVVLHRTGGERLMSGYYIRREYWNGVSLAAVDRVQNGHIYCYCKAWARLAQTFLIVVPAWIYARLAGNTRAELLSSCRRRKYFGYWSAVMGLAKTPA